MTSCNDDKNCNDDEKVGASCNITQPIHRPKLFISKARIRLGLGDGI
jgi:hypothetical protein